AALWRAEFEWWAHYPIAIKAGISPSVAESIRRAERPEFSRPEEAVVYEFVQTLVQDRRVPDALYEHALHVLGQDRVVDLVGLAGYYTLISMTLNVFDIQPPDGEPAQFDLLDKEL
ncbi:MAG TPA: carboxymuconolactone decarboxylase family protein, partial [Pusillimonas sp.]